MNINSFQVLLDNLNAGDRNTASSSLQGNLAVVAVNHSSLNRRLVHVLELSDSSWKLQQQIRPDSNKYSQIGHKILLKDDYIFLTATHDAVTDHKFGESVSFDGVRALVGAIYDSTAGRESGAAYIFIEETIFDSNFE